MLLLMWACASPSTDVFVEPLFVHNGLLVSSRSPEAALGERLGRHHFIARDWSPGQRVELSGKTWTAPQNAECAPVFSVPLGHVGVSPGAAPDTALAFSPQGERLAVASSTGELLIVSTRTGEVQSKIHIAEGYFKTLKWSADGQSLYAGEQSPDAYLHRYSVDLVERWRLSLSKWIQSSPLPPASDLYGRYTLPGIFGLETLPDQTLLVTGVHAWPDSSGARKNASVLLRVSPDGEALAEWPAPEQRGITLMAPAVFEDTLAIRVGHSANTPPPAGFAIDGVQLLSLADFSLGQAYQAPPLKPWFTKAFIWEGVDLNTSHVLTALTDGRAILWDRVGQASVQLDLGTPITAGEVPIYASIGHARLVPQGIAVITSGTNIPYGSASPELRPPRLHPGENTVWLHNMKGEERWHWQGKHELNGLTVGANRLVVGTGPRKTDHRTDLFGLLVFDLDGSGQPSAICETQGPVFFRQAMSSGGLIAAVEVPWSDSEGLNRGDYRLVVFR